MAKDGALEVWSKQLSDGGRAVVLFNRDTKAQEITATWEQLGYPSHLSAEVRNLWQKKDLGNFTGRFSAQ